MQMWVAITQKVFKNICLKKSLHYAGIFLELKEFMQFKIKNPSDMFFFTLQVKDGLIHC